MEPDGYIIVQPHHFHTSFLIKHDIALAQQFTVSLIVCVLYLRAKHREDGVERKCNSVNSLMLYECNANHEGSYV